jgi:hypothetical protein
MKLTVAQDAYASISTHHQLRRFKAVPCSI